MGLEGRFAEAQGAAEQALPSMESEVVEGAEWPEVSHEGVGECKESIKPRRQNNGRWGPFLRDWAPPAFFLSNQFPKPLLILLSSKSESSLLKLMLNFDLIYFN